MRDVCVQFLGSQARPGASAWTLGRGLGRTGSPADTHRARPGVAVPRGRPQNRHLSFFFFNPSSYLPGILEGFFSSVALHPTGRGVAPCPVQTLSAQGGPFPRDHACIRAPAPRPDPCFFTAVALKGAA